MAATLGIDFGTSHVGLALSDGRISEPLATVDTKDALIKTLFFIDTHKVNTVIIGSGGEEVSPLVHEFASSLKAQQIHLNIVLVDETLSSKDAVTALLHTTPSRRKKLEHAAAAALILQSWLDSQVDSNQTSL